jgi:GxxExxY protein
MTEEEVGHALIGAAIKVHSVLGPGLRESTYEACLVYELEKLGLQVRSQAAIPIKYEDLVIEPAYRVDLLIEETVVAELKVVDTILSVHRSQLLKLGGFKLGYLLNFNVTRMHDGIIRMVNGL